MTAAFDGDGLRRAYGLLLESLVYTEMRRVLGFGCVEFVEQTLAFRRIEHFDAADRPAWVCQCFLHKVQQTPRMRGQRRLVVQVHVAVDVQFERGGAGLPDDRDREIVDHAIGQ